ncbi:RpsU Ribosomal protein S21 [uncultured Caudovirales phage]|uniref:RpsU Ribosomal protein S21 n=1 Tax=uncultured Caudovirales phage TaxID=2100421 RepID=A0A6J5SV59_9CAUD|nr:RpsU Ribosomal protein S21 [uncultured Caudovirales phage]
MLIVNVKENGTLDRALKVLKRKFEKTGTVKQLRSRKEFIKPSIKRRQEIRNAQYRQSLNND